ncbi:heme NO-binding domain-containing protein [Sulfitobacter sp. S0837]|uniref:heme NO-binding domain-containing protein n=1 Tax=Sulfitobacter maritimus TaxID=2741719 RepID=UPI0015830425|nr:heme NO-binding domain-containing protein [Sulfitobacter maritimus]NUH66083.1 heme NO-binding domain-containing protein [Sulfitobacter maritimus]
MHGLINRSIQNYVCDSYGPSCWAEATQRAGLEFTEFEAMLSYADDLTPRMLDAVCEVLERSRPEVMEDIGTYLVSHPTYEAVRRLLRFGGVNFSDFLHSLDDLPDRAKLALADLDLPNIELREHDEGRFSLICDAPVAGYGHLLMGVLRVMADDYGALVLLDHMGRNDGVETLTIKVVEADYSAGRSFDLGARA